MRDGSYFGIVGSGEIGKRIVFEDRIVFRKGDFGAMLDQSELLGSHIWSLGFGHFPSWLNEGLRGERFARRDVGRGNKRDKRPV